MTSTRGELRVLKRRPAGLARGAWPFAFSLVWWPSLMSGAGAGTAHFLFWTTLGAITLRRELVHNRNPVAVPVPYEIGPESLTVGQASYARSGIRAGYVVPGPTPRVRLHPRERFLPLDVELSSHEAAQSFLDELHLGAGQHAAVFHAVAGTPKGFWGWSLRLVPFLLLFLLWAQLGFAQGWFMLALLLPAVLHNMGWRRRAIVGSDGVRVERGLAWDRYLPFDTIAEVKVYRVKRNRDHYEAAIVTHEGEETRVGFQSDAEAHAFRRRVEDAKSRATAVAPAAEALVHHRGDVAGWIQQLRTVTQRHSHRDNAISADALWPLLESPSAKPLQRAAAAVALGGLDDGSRQRVGEVAAATASPRLRVVFDAVHEGSDDEALAEALAALEADDEAAQA